MPVPSPFRCQVQGDVRYGKVVILEVNDGCRLDIWLGKELRGKQRLGNHALAVAQETYAYAVLPVSFHWWTGRGFLVLGHVAQEGQNLVSPNTDVLLKRRCYFAVTQNGKFLVGETNLTTGKLLSQLPPLRLLLGGAGWLVREGDPTAWRQAIRQGFRPDVVCSYRERVVVAVDRDGAKAWLVLFMGRVSLQQTAEWVYHRLPCHSAIFFDGGRNTALALYHPADGTWEIFSTSNVLPETPCFLLVR